MSSMLAALSVYCCSIQLCIIRGVNCVKISGGMGTRRLSGSGRVLHYPALPGPGRVLRQNVAGSE